MPDIAVVYVGENRDFLKGLQKRYVTYHARSGKKALTLVKEHHQATVVVLDAASLGTTGERICQRLRSELPDMAIVHIYDQKPNKRETPADEVLVLPFTSRKLNNAVERLVTATTVNSSELLACGPFAMSVEKRVLLAHGKEINLTPKQAALIEAFFKHPNETLDRAWLMHQIWDTTYTGDTRTLDVHIRWVRRVLEEGSSKPKHLKTVRGKGYKLEVPINKNGKHATE
ncbi:response regulator transcription factor [Phototrophicus methaneseepsis]|uniref:Response regulator transcription factor n=1 Tax=Phototrophicus methaneseepsis TaxID=2710758 RepID=A0A7S8E519_9CHLR|nr:response regulator transcription factor [Phototrophicus methaneseepsis]QPC80497.1 response regulator transcription factor [Phototrophicus methaneseepsis]